MQETLSQLIDLQKMDKRIAELQAVITNTPLQIKTIEEKIAKGLKGKESITNELEENKKKYAELERELNEKKELLSSSQKKLTSVQNNKEYESVLRELDTLKKNISDGDVQLKEMMNSNFKYESELSTINDLLCDLDKQMKELSHDKVDEDKEMREELGVLLKKREAFAETMKKSTIIKYDRVRSHRNNIGVASVKDEICNGCYMHIPPQLYVDVKKDKAIYSCPHCQRILYYEQEGE